MIQIFFLLSSFQTKLHHSSFPFPFPLPPVVQPGFAPDWDLSGKILSGKIMAVTLLLLNYSGKMFMSKFSAKLFDNGMLRHSLDTLEGE